MSTVTPVDIYEPVIAEIRAKIEGLQKSLEVIEALRDNGIPNVGKSASPAQQYGSAFSNDSFFGLTVAEAVKKYLSAVKKTANVQTICDALVAGGWKTSAKNIPENVRTILSRTPDFVRINGEFGLAEWYPGRKNVGRRVSSASNATTEESKTSPGEPSSEPPQPSEQ